MVNTDAFAGDIWPSSGLIWNNWEMNWLLSVFSKETQSQDSRNPGKLPGKNGLS